MSARARALCALSFFVQGKWNPKERKHAGFSFFLYFLLASCNRVRIFARESEMVNTKRGEGVGEKEKWGIDATIRCPIDRWCLGWYTPTLAIYSFKFILPVKKLRGVALASMLEDETRGEICITVLSARRIDWRWYKYSCSLKLQNETKGKKRRSLSKN